MSIEERLIRIEQYTLLAAKDALTMDDAAAYTGLSKAYLYRLVHEKQIPYYKGHGVGNGSKITYFAKSELQRWLLKHRVATTEEMQEQAAAYVLNNPRSGRRASHRRAGNASEEKGGAQ